MTTSQCVFKDGTVVVVVVVHPGGEAALAEAVYPHSEIEYINIITRDWAIVVPPKLLKLSS